MRSAKDPRADAELGRAEDALRKRRREGNRFASVSATLGFYYSKRHQLQAPQSPSPRVAQTYHGETVAQPRVDGGRGGNVEDVLATLYSVHQGVNALAQDHPKAHRVLELVYEGGLVNGDVGRAMGASPATISAWRNAGEMYLLAWLRQAEIIE